MVIAHRNTEVDIMNNVDHNLIIARWAIGVISGVGEGDGGGGRRRNREEGGRREVSKRRTANDRSRKRKWVYGVGA